MFLSVELLILSHINEKCLRIVYEMKLQAVIKDQSKNGLYSIKIRVTANRKIGYVSTDFYCLKNDFDSKNGFLKEIKIKEGQETPELLSKQNAHNFQNATIREMKASYNLKYAKLTDKDRDIKWLTEYFKDSAGENLNLITYYDGFIKQLIKQGRTSYAESHHSTKSRIEKFAGNKNVTFKNVNYTFLEDFENSMRKDECSINTISIYMRNLRVIFNDAIKREKIELGLYPFRRYQLARRLKPIIKKRNLSIEAIKKLRNMVLTDKSEILARDIFMLSFYLIGINIKDLYNLEAIVDGRIRYQRAKTKRNYDIKIFPAAMQLINKYKGTKKLLIFKEQYVDVKNLTKIVNRKLNAIANPKDSKVKATLTTYYARHSWATIASKLDVSRDIIRQALGHGAHGVTDVYIDFDISKVDNANEIVINSIT